MTDYAAPGYLLFSDLFLHFQKKEGELIKIGNYLNKDKFKLENSITEIDELNCAALEKVLNDLESFQPLKCNFITTDVDTWSQTNKTFSITSVSDDNKLFNAILGKDKVVHLDVLEMKKHLMYSKLLREIRDALSENKINGYYVVGSEYKKAYQQVWLKHNCWYSLITTNKILLRELTDVNFFTHNPSNSDKTIIYFKLDEVTKLLEIRTTTPAIQDQEKSDQPDITFHLITPWIEVMLHFSSKYENQIYYISKESIVAEMLEYITQRNLDIAKSDVPYLAKFIRDPEQRKGKAFNKPLL